MSSPVRRRLPDSSVFVQFFSAPGCRARPTPRKIPPETKPGAPESVLDTAITCEVTNGADAVTAGSVETFLTRSAGFQTPPSFRSIVICGVNESRRPRKSSWNPHITDNATVSAQVPSVTPASEIIAISRGRISRAAEPASNADRSGIRSATRHPFPARNRCAKNGLLGGVH